MASATVSPVIETINDEEWTKISFEDFNLCDEIIAVEEDSCSSSSSSDDEDDEVDKGNKKRVRFLDLEEQAYNNMNNAETGSMTSMLDMVQVYVPHFL